MLGATGIFTYNAFFFGALGQLPASRSALIIATNPARTAVAAWLILRLRFDRWQRLGVAVLILGEPLPASMVIGGLVALAGVTLTILERRPA